MPLPLPLPEFTRLSRKYVWWSDVARVAEEPHLLLATVMDKGTWDDLCIVRSKVDPNVLRDVLLSPPRGLFRPGSWNLWHLWLGLPLRQLPAARAFQ
jgi:hypothetical protein